MAVKKSRKYEVDGASYAFDFVSDKLAGIKKVVNDVLTPVDSTTTEFDTISSSDESLNAFNGRVDGEGMELRPIRYSGLDRVNR